MCQPIKLSSSSCVFPAIYLGFTFFGEIFAYMTILNPTIEVVTFRVHGWCMLGGFLWLAFTCLGHECQDLLSPALECMCAQTRPWFIVSSERVVELAKKIRPQDTHCMLLRS